MPHTLNSCSRIIVAGGWGAGKSTVADLTARKLGWAMQDADTVIDAFSASVLSGDTAALAERSRRLRALIGSHAPRPLIVATTMRPLLNETGQLFPEVEAAIVTSRCLVVEIRRDVRDVAICLSGDASQRAMRPHLRGQTVEEITRELNGLADSLATLYRTYRTFSVSACGKTATEVASEVIEELARRGVGSARVAMLRSRFTAAQATRWADRTNLAS